MKKIVFVFVSMFFMLNVISLQAQELRKHKNEAFKRGEKLKYRVYYDAILTGKVTAGMASLEVKSENKLIANRPTFHVEALGKTQRTFNWFFKVVDRYETFIDEDAIVPWLFIRRINEGGYVKNQDITFNQITNTAYYKNNMNGNKESIKIPKYTQDVISALYYARTLDITKDFTIKFMLDDSLYVSKVKYAGKETITTRLGTFKCIKLKPMVLKGEVFNDPYPMNVWITDDKNHIPILASSKVLVGSVNLELVKYSGLASPLKSKIK